MAVAVGEQRRKREAMDLLVSEISKGEEENIANSIRVAIEVKYHAICLLRTVFNLLFCFRSEGGCRALWTV